MSKVIKALEYASKKHKGAIRKYSGEAYIIHPIIVSEICKKYTTNEDTVICAILHDVVEDSDATFQDLHNLFGAVNATDVRYCSEVSEKWDGDREYRKRIDREHYAKGTFSSKMVKIADAIHNCSSMGDSHSSFTQLYFSEKVLMIDAILDTLDKSDATALAIFNIADQFKDMLDNWTKVGIFIETIKR